MIKIVDIGLGNPESVRNMLSYIGVDTECHSQPCEIDPTDRLILPGVGAYDEGIKRLKSSGWYEEIKALPLTTHILGICLGMQLLGNSSSEGQLAGLERVPLNFELFRDPTVKIPHIGWNEVRRKGVDPLFDFGDLKPRFYFTHSYRTIDNSSKYVIGETKYGELFAAAFRNQNTIGVQFHPEKSHQFGIRFFKNWLDLKC